MSKLSLLAAGVLAASLPAQQYKVGKAPTPEELKQWDIGIGPSGKELPPGAGNAAQGKRVYDMRCKRCHGDDAKGGDEAALVGGQGSLTSPKPLKTIGSYWPYATTLFDYVRRAMPFKDPGTLSNEQVYQLTAYLLAANGIIQPGDTMNAETLPKVKMPNRDNFLADPRPDTGAKAKRK
jgi:cytochrome c